MMMITVSSVAFVGRRGKLFPDLPSDLTGSSLTPREHFLEKIGNVLETFFENVFGNACGTVTITRYATFKQM